MAKLVNDENAHPVNKSFQPQGPPTENDRIRLGFKRTERQGPAPAARLPTNAPTPPSMKVPDVAQLAEEELGDLEEAIKLIRQKAIAPKLEFKLQIDDLKTQIGPLKDELKKRVKSEMALKERMATEQQEIEKSFASVDEMFVEQARQHEERFRQEVHKHAETLKASAAREAAIAKDWQHKIKTQEDQHADEVRSMHEAKLLAEEGHRKEFESEELRHAAEVKDLKDSAAAAELSWQQRLEEKENEYCKKETDKQLVFESMLAELQQEVAQVEAKSKSDMAEAEKEHQQRMRALQSKLESMEEDYKARLQQAEKRLEEYKVESDNALQQAQSKAEESEATLTLKFATDLDKEREEHARELESLKTAAALAEKESQQKREQQELHLKTEFADRLKQERERHASEAESWRADSAANNEAWRKKQEKQQREFLEKERRKQTVHEEEMRQREQQLEEAHAEIKLALEKLHAELESMQAELRQSGVECDKLREAVGEEQAELQNRQKELDRALAGLSKVEHELAQAASDLAATKKLNEELSREKRDLEIKFESYKESNENSNHAQLATMTDLKLAVDKLTQRVDHQDQELVLRSNDVAEHQSSLRRLELQLIQSEADRRRLHNTIQELKGNIRVMCRVRPAPNVPHALTQSADTKLSLSHAGDNQGYTFDHVFGIHAVQTDLFNETSGLVQSALDGYKVCIFAYGQTGSGKTFTMQGGSDPETWGLIPRSLRQIFDEAGRMRSKGWHWSLKASFMEVYNEVIRDLLREGSTCTPQCHTIKHDEDWGMAVTNMTCVDVDSVEQIQSLMVKAARLRAVGGTDMNAQSSRSHSIFALYLSGSNTELNSELRGALHLVDLAGSERLDKSGSVGDRLKETQNINRSLSSLADVFTAKAEGRSHVPFRNSKLTHLMEPCLSGHGKTVMIVNVGPEASNSHETLCSLRFASQVSQCNTGGKPKRSAKALVKPPENSASSSSAGNNRGAMSAKTKGGA